MLYIAQYMNTTQSNWMVKYGIRMKALELLLQKYLESSGKRFENMFGGRWSGIWPFSYPGLIMCFIYEPFFGEGKVHAKLFYYLMREFPYEIIWNFGNLRPLPRSEKQMSFLFFTLKRFKW